LFEFEFEFESNRTAPPGTMSLGPTHQRLPSPTFCADHECAAYRPIPLWPRLAPPPRSPCACHRTPPLRCYRVAPSASPSPTSTHRIKNGTAHRCRSLFPPPPLLLSTHSASTTSPPSTSCPLRPTGALPLPPEFKPKPPSVASSGEPGPACLTSSNQAVTHLPLIGIMLLGLTEDVIGRRSLPTAIECRSTPLLFPLIVAPSPRCVSTTVTLLGTPFVP
jgi:hypothetical protein